MDIKYLLEKAKELLKKEKGLMPVLFVETEKAISIIGLVGEFNKIDKRKMMIGAGKKFATEQPNNRIRSLSMVSEANVSKINIKTNAVVKCEAIVIAKLNVIDNKKEIISQDFERSYDGITFKDSHYELNAQGTFLLEAFMKGYYQAIHIQNQQQNVLN